AMRLRFAVITSVNRDDRKDGGAELFAHTIRAIRRRVPGCGVEVLVPDFQGSHAAMEIVMEAAPDVLNHNTETVPRLYRQVRLGVRYVPPEEFSAFRRAGEAMGFLHVEAGPLVRSSYHAGTLHAKADRGGAQIF